MSRAKLHWHLQLLSMTTTKLYQVLLYSLFMGVRVSNISDDSLRCINLIVQLTTVSISYSGLWVMLSRTMWWGQ